MATLYISEFSNAVSGINTSVAQIFPQPSVTDQTVTIGGSSTQSAAFNSATRAVLLTTDTACCIAFGSDPTATAGNLMLPANGPPIGFGVVPGQKVAVIDA